MPRSAEPDADVSSRHKREGDRHVARDDFAAAAACYRRALAADSSNVDACVGLAFALREQRVFDEAEHHLKRALSIDPGIADVHYMLGTIAKERNDPEASIRHFSSALDLKPDFQHAYQDLLAVLLQDRKFLVAKDVVRKAIAVCPQSAELHYYLGRLFMQDEDHENAARCYRRGLEIQPDSAELHAGLGEVHSVRGQIDQAIHCYQQALAHDPHFVHAHVGLGTAMESRGDIDGAVSTYRQAIALKPDFAAAHHALGNVWLKQGATQAATACFREVIRLQPQNSVAHLLTALAGGDSERAPDDYVEQLFDHYAQKFDSHLVQVLSYDVPAKLIGLVRQRASTAEKWTVLDLGCGTGLCGVAIANEARRLVGVDLSERMLEKAKARNLYDRLERGDLMAMMQKEPPSGYDVVLAADVLVYLGKLDELARQVRRLLRPGGVFAFSVESLPECAPGDGTPEHRQDYRLNASGRYAHSRGYLARIAASNGLETLTMAETTVRVEKGAPVQGYLALWGHPSE